MYTVMLLKNSKKGKYLYDLCYENKFVWKEYGTGTPHRFPRLSGDWGAVDIANGMLSGVRGFMELTINSVG